MTIDLVDLAALGIAVLLVWSAVTKARNLAGFADVLTSTYGVPRAGSTVVAALVVGCEVTTASLLILAPRPIGLVVAATLFSTFAVVTARAVALGRTGPCGCEGDRTAAALGHRTTIRAAVLAAVCLGAAGLSTTMTTIIPETLPPGLALTAVLGCSIAAVAGRAAWALRAAARAGGR